MADDIKTEVSAVEAPVETAAAAIEAMIVVYALGGTDEEAMDACRAIAGDAC